MGMDAWRRLKSLIRWMNACLDNPSDETSVSLPAVGSRICTPDEIAIQLASVLWAQRGSLDVRLASGWGEDDGRNSLHSKEICRFRVTVPGGLVMSFDEECDRFSLTSPGGETMILSNDDALTVGMVWKSIQAEGICIDMGTELPETGSGSWKGIVAALDSAVATILETFDPPVAKEVYGIPYRDASIPSEWQELVPDVFIRLCDSGLGTRNADGRPETYRIMTTGMGVLRMSGHAVGDAIRRRRSASFADALGIARALPVHLPMPSGNAKAARVLRLCREAVAREPDLVDAAGTPIAPLVEEHLPRLMRTHAEASRIAEAHELASIDSDLMEGIERVRLAVEEALVVSRVDRREALRTELAFLEYRHPSPNQLQIESPETAR